MCFEVSLFSEHCSLPLGKTLQVFKVSAIYIYIYLFSLCFREQGHAAGKDALQFDRKAQYTSQLDSRKSNQELCQPTLCLTSMWERLQEFMQTVHEGQVQSVHPAVGKSSVKQMFLCSGMRKQGKSQHAVYKNSAP